MSETAIQEAACVCGQLRIGLRGEPKYVSSCACQACQRRTGAPFGVTAFYGAAQVTEQLGARTTYRRTAESGNGIDYHFCPECGSTVWWDADARPGMVCVAGGMFADRDYPAPQRMIWAEHCADWVRPPEGAPVFPKGPA
jgi:hypothetical protein